MHDGAASGPGGLPPEIPTDQLAALLDADADRTHGCQVLDGRSTTDPPDDHLRGSAWIPWGGRIAAHLLPARGRPLVIWWPTQGAAERARDLTLAGWPTRWNADPALEGRLVPGPATGAAWDVDPMLVRSVDALPRSGLVLDLGCGSSREGIFLAQRGLDVVLVDRLPDALELAADRARRHGVEHRVERIERRVREAGDLPDGPFSVIVHFRFLQRALLPALRSRLTSGGWLVLRCYGTLVDGSATADRGPRNPNERIGPEELDTLLGDGWMWVEPPCRTVEDGTTWVTAVGRRVD